jgi:hypothetical protein
MDLEVETLGVRRGSLEVLGLLYLTVSLGVRKENFKVSGLLYLTVSVGVRR